METPNISYGIGPAFADHGAGLTPLRRLYSPGLSRRVSSPPWQRDRVSDGAQMAVRAVNLGGELLYPPPFKPLRPPCAVVSRRALNSRIGFLTCRKRRNDRLG